MNLKKISEKEFEIRLLICERGLFIDYLIMNLHFNEVSVYILEYIDNLWYFVFYKMTNFVNEVTALWIHITLKKTRVEYYGENKIPHLTSD